MMLGGLGGLGGLYWEKGKRASGELVVQCPELKITAGFHTYICQIANRPFPKVVGRYGHPHTVTNIMATQLNQMANQIMKWLAIIMANIQKISSGWWGSSGLGGPIYTLTPSTPTALLHRNLTN